MEHQRDDNILRGRALAFDVLPLLPPLWRAKKNNFPTEDSKDQDQQNKGVSPQNSTSEVQQHQKTSKSSLRPHRAGRILSMVTELTKPPQQAVVLTLACYDNRLWALEMPRSDMGPLKGTRIFSLAENKTDLPTEADDDRVLTEPLQPEGFVQDNGTEVVFSVNVKDIN